MANGVVVGGINRTQQSIRGAGDVYSSFYRNPTQIAAFHGIPTEHAQKLVDLVQRGDEAAVVKVLMANPHWLYLWELLYGGIRSGKTFAIAFRCWMTAMRIPGCKILVARKRKEQLRNTFLDEFEKVGKIISDGNVSYIGEMQPERDGALEYHVWSGKHVSKVIFAIEPDQQTEKEIMERWKGYTVLAAVTEETPQLREISVRTIFSRVSQERDEEQRSVGHYRWMATICNPVKPEHYLAKMRSDNEVTYALGGRPYMIVIRSKPVDNMHNLPTGYIEQQREALKGQEHLIRSWLEGEDEIETHGKPVYGAQFNEKLHVDSMLQFNQYLPLHRGWDFGYHRPACVFAQEDQKGCINILAEILGENETAEQFCDKVKQFTADHFPGVQTIKDYGDPAAAQQTDKGDTTVAILMKKGIRLNFKPTFIDAGLKIIRSLLSKNRGTPARPELVFSPACSILIDAFKVGYHYLEFKDGTYSMKPHKDGYYDHLCDAIRYLLMGLRGALYQQVVESDVPNGGGMDKPIVAIGAEPMDMD